jgi:hypothetical protein
MTPPCKGGKHQRVRKLSGGAYLWCLDCGSSKEIAPDRRTRWVAPGPRRTRIVRKAKRGQQLAMFE